MLVGHDAELHLLLALLEDVAERTSTRMLVIKGPSSEQHRLREAEYQCGDIDLLTTAHDVDSVVAELEHRGWQRRPEDEDTTTFPPHSHTLSKRGWAHDIDVHFSYPGIEHPHMFETFWARRVELDGTGLWTVDRDSALLIAVLHSLRNLTVQRHREELRTLERIGRTQFDQIGLQQLTKAVDAGGALEPYFTAVWNTKPPGFGVASEQWTLRTQLADPTVRRLYLIGHATGRQRWHLIRAALAPSAPTLYKSETRVEQSARASVQRRLRRLLRGAVALPRAIVSAMRFAQRQRRARRISED